MRLEGKVDLVLSKFDALRDDNRSLRANQWVIGFGLAVLIVAVAALFPVFFSIGTQVRDPVHSEIQSQLPEQSLESAARQASMKVAESATAVGRFGVILFLHFRFPT